MGQIPSGPRRPKNKQSTDLRAGWRIRPQGRRRQRRRLVLCPSEVLLEAADLRAHLCCQEERLGVIPEDDVDVAAGGSRDRDFHECSPARSDRSQDVLDDLALDPIMDPGTCVRVCPQRQVGAEDIGDPNQDRRARLRRTLFDSAQVARTDPDRSRHRRLRQCRILAKSSKLPADRRSDLPCPRAPPPLVLSCTQGGTPSCKAELHPAGGRFRASEPNLALPALITPRDRQMQRCRHDVHWR